MREFHGQYSLFNSCPKTVTYVANNVEVREITSENMEVIELTDITIQNGGEPFLYDVRGTWVPGSTIDPDYYISGGIRITLGQESSQNRIWPLYKSEKKYNYGAILGCEYGYMPAGAYLATPPTEPDVKTYTFGKDSYSFTNIKSNFLTANEVKDLSTLPAFVTENASAFSDKYYQQLVSGQNGFKTAIIKSMLNFGFYDNSLGMAATNGMIFKNHLELSKLQNVNNAYSLSAPRRNQVLQDAIIYHQLIGNLDEFTNLQFAKGTTNKEKIKTLKTKLKSKKPDSNPVLLGFENTEKKAGNWLTHYVLAYKIEDGTGDILYKITCYDPNDPTKPLELKVYKDYSFQAISSNKIYYDSKKGVNITCALDMDTGYLFGNSFTMSLKPINTNFTANKTYVISNTDTIDFTIGKETISYKDGKQVNNSNSVELVKYIDGNEAVFSFNNISEFIITTPNANAESITIIRTESNSNNGIVIQADELAKDTKLTVKNNGGNIELSNASNSNYRVSYASSKNSTELNMMAVTGTGKGITLTPTNTGAKIESSDSKVNVIMSGKAADKVYTDIDMKNDLIVKASGSNVTFTDKNGKTLNIEQKQMLGDVNGDKKIDTLDAVVILQSVAKKITLNETQKAVADVNKDGKVDTLDAVRILQYVAKKITAL